MSDERTPPAPDRLPTLTEILQLGPRGEMAPAAPSPAPPPIPLPSCSPDTPSPLDVAALEQRVLAELVQRIDARLEARLRETLAPALARAADGLIRDVRGQLMPALAEMVGDAVAQALAADRAHGPPLPGAPGAPGAPSVWPE